MRVAVIGEKRADSFAENLVVCLNDGGHAAVGVSQFEHLRYNSLVARVLDELHALPWAAAWYQRELLQQIEAAEPELILVLDYRLPFQLIGRLRAATGVPVAFWFPDSPGNLRRETHVLSGYDALFFKDTTLVRRYRDLLGLNAHFLPEACNPRWHRPIGDVTSGHRPSVLIAGTMYPTRYVFVKALLKEGVRVRVAGPAWTRWLPDDTALRGCYTGRYVVREGKAREFRAAPVVLNSLASHEGDGLNCRLFEAAACGAIVLTEWRARLCDFFSAREVLSYRTLPEAIRLIHELTSLDHTQRRERGDAAAARAHNEHSYLQRFETILAALGAG